MTSPDSATLSEPGLGIDGLVVKPPDTDEGNG